LKKKAFILIIISVFMMVAAGCRRPGEESRDSTAHLPETDRAFDGNVAIDERPKDVPVEKQSPENKAAENAKDEISIDKIVNGHDMVLSIKGGEVKRTCVYQYDKYIYYYKVQWRNNGEFDWGESGIYKVEKDGKGCIKVFNLGINDPVKFSMSYVESHKRDFIIIKIESMRVEGDWIYYKLQDGKKYKIKTDGKENQIDYSGMSVDEIVNSFEGDFSGTIRIRDHIIVEKNWIYFYKEDSYSDEVIWGESAIYKIKRDGSESIMVVNTANDDVLKYDPDYVNAHKKEFAVNRLQSIEINGNWIYYKTIDGKSFIVKSDGSEKHEQ
jgi:hypothetical protein